MLDTNIPTKQVSLQYSWLQNWTDCVNCELSVTASVNSCQCDDTWNIFILNRYKSYNSCVGTVFGYLFSCVCVYS